MELSFVLAMVVIGVVGAFVLARNARSRVALIASRGLALALALAGVAIFFTDSSATVVTRASVAGAEPRVTYDRILCTSRFDDFPMPYRGASATGSSVVAVEQAQVCVPQRRLRKTFSFGLALIGASALVGTRRRRVSDAPAVDIDEVRRGASVV